MKNFCSVVVFCLFFHLVIKAQNLGIGISTPLTRLHVYAGASGSLGPFGPMAVESNTSLFLNILTPDANESGILFGQETDAAHGGIVFNNTANYGGLQFRTGGNNTRMVLSGLGYLGIGNTIPAYILDISQRMRLRSGGSNSAGIWLNNTNNASLQSFIGIENNTYTGIYTSGGGYSFGVSSINGDVKIMSRLGIGTTTFNAPVSFPPLFGKKLTLYPGGTGDYGIAVQSNLLQIYTDYPGADIAFGYDQGGTIIEKFRLKGNGGFALSGNAGAVNNVFTSGGNAAAQFQSLANFTKTSYGIPGNYVNSWEVGASTDAEVQLTNLANTITVTENSRLMISASAHFSSFCAGLDCIGSVWFYFKVNGVAGKPSQMMTTTEMKSLSIAGYAVDVPAGAHTITFFFKKGFSNDNQLTANGIMATAFALPL